MFKKAKRKIVVTIFTILCTVLIGTLLMVCLSSYYSITIQNYEVLEEHVKKLVNVENPKLNKDEDEKPNQFKDVMHGKKRIERHLEVNTFYSVKISSTGVIEVIENGANGIYSDQELIDIAKGLSSKTRGTTGDLLYLVSTDNNDTIICFMDNIIFTDNFARLFLHTLLLGILAIIAITIISIRIADRIIAPMEETYKKQKQFTADAGHELKSPIAAMAANIEILQRQIGDNKWLENISYENERMRELVTELLELARNEHRTMEREIIDLSNLINGVILPLEATAFEHNILIESDIKDGIRTNVDEKSIRQLMTILLDNAISHTKCVSNDIEKIFVKLDNSKGRALLTVSNPGEEIPEKERDNLFERFYRTDSSHEFTGHYGLGLAIAKAIADANEAKISVSCQNGLVSFSVLFSSK